MAEKRCCIEGCSSSSISEQDKGVTFHKFPHNIDIRYLWLKATHIEEVENPRRYVCSRHFRKVDFLNLIDNKYILRPDAVPSIFPWGIIRLLNEKKMSDDSDGETEGFIGFPAPEDEGKKLSYNDYVTEIENIEKYTQILESTHNRCTVASSAKPVHINKNKNEVTHKTNKSTVSSNHNRIYSDSQSEVTDDVDLGDYDIKNVIHSELTPPERTANVIDKILHKNEVGKTVHKKKKNGKTYRHYRERGGILSLSVGSRVEAKDYRGLWHPAQIMEVDYDDMEVLVHFNTYAALCDEWIHVGSPRLRPAGGSGEGLVRAPPTFRVGERCLARWSNNGKFPATVRALLADGKYEVIFDDGFLRICSASGLFKLKQQSQESHTLDHDPSHESIAQVPCESLALASDYIPSPAATLPLIPFHKHLFDPTRDYLGPRSERREKSRKLNVKELFNIGQRQISRKKSLDGSTPRRSKLPRKFFDVNNKLSPLVTPKHSNSLHSSFDVPDFKEEIHDLKEEVSEIKDENFELHGSSEDRADTPPFHNHLTDSVDEDDMKLIELKSNKFTNKILNDENSNHSSLKSAIDVKNIRTCNNFMSREADIQKDDNQIHPSDLGYFEENCTDNNDLKTNVSKLKHNDCSSSEGESITEKGIKIKNQSDSQSSPILKFNRSKSNKLNNLYINEPDDKLKKIKRSKSIDLSHEPPVAVKLNQSTRELRIEISPLSERHYPKNKLGVTTTDTSSSVLNMSADSPQRNKENINDSDFSVNGSPGGEARSVDNECGKEGSETRNAVEVSDYIDGGKDDLDAAEDIEVVKVYLDDVQDDDSLDNYYDLADDPYMGGDESCDYIPKKSKKKKSKKSKSKERFGKLIIKLPPKGSRGRHERFGIGGERSEAGTGGGRRYEGSLQEGEWCCRWVDGQPQGVVSELEPELAAARPGQLALPRRSVQVEDHRLPPGWTKHMVRRSVGSSAGKWDVVLVCPQNRRFRTKHEVRSYLDTRPDAALARHERALLDFGVHRKLARRLGWDCTSADVGDAAPGSPVPAPPPPPPLPPAAFSPLVAKKKRRKEMKRKLAAAGDKPAKKRKVAGALQFPVGAGVCGGGGAEEARAYGSYIVSSDGSVNTPMAAPVLEPLEEGYVYVGSMKVQVIENLLRCPADGCFKNFRKDDLLRMHIKHYHKELIQKLGLPPKVADMASARTVNPELELLSQRIDGDSKKHKSKSSHKEHRNSMKKVKDLKVELKPEPLYPSSTENIERLKGLGDSPKLRSVLESNTAGPKKPCKVLFPVRKSEANSEQSSPGADRKSEEKDPDFIIDSRDHEAKSDPKSDPSVHKDLEDEIFPHTVPKSGFMTSFEKFIQKGKRKVPRVKPRKKKRIVAVSDDDDEWMCGDEELDRSGYNTPDSRPGPRDSRLQPCTPASDSVENGNYYVYTDSGERLKIEQMKPEEIINCACNFKEEDGLMIQCELCLCWQHGHCYGIERESQVPEKYVCAICRSPRGGRRSMRYLHEQDALYEGRAAGGVASTHLRRAHELSGNLLRVRDALHALRLKCHVASKKDHPKLYLWAKDWEQPSSQESLEDKLNSEYAALSAVMGEIDKENLPLKSREIKDVLSEFKSPPSEGIEGLNSSKDDVSLANLLASPGGASLDLPISTLELERLAKSVQESELVGEAGSSGVTVGEGGGTALEAGPQPEPAIESGACRERLLRHVERAHRLVDTRLDTIEAQVAELESQEPSCEDDETAEYFPKTKQTLQMLLRDLDTLEELGNIT